MEGIFPGQNKGADGQYQQQQKDVGTTKYARCEHGNGLFENIKFRDIHVSGQLVKVSGIPEGKQIFKHLEGIGHAFAAEKKQGKIEKGKGKKPTEPPGNIKAGRGLFLDAPNAHNA